MRNRLVVPLFALLLCPMVLHGQSTSARLSGTMTDASGAVIPGAVVTATDTATGWKTTATSGTEGQYVLYPLQPGAYRISIRRTGFRPVDIEELQLYASDNVVRNVVLAVGSVRQEVTVSAVAEAAVLEQSASVQNTVTREQIDDLPLDGRDYNQLVFLSAGAVDYKVAGTNYDPGTVAVNGNRSYSNEYTVDGVSNSYTYQARAAIPLSLGVIREFKVISGVAAAEYGRAGTNVTMVSRSGTNQFHGSLFEYYRGNVMLARDPASPEPPAPMSSHQFGGAAGGPVLLPHYDGHNRTFFFFNYEGQRQQASDTRVTTVAPDTFWSGDFSSLLARGITIRDPLTSGRPIFPGNIIPTSRLNQTTLKMRPMFPRPTLPGLANNYVVNVNETINNDQFTIRADHLLPHNHSLSVRVTYYNSTDFAPGLYGLPNMGVNSPDSGKNGSIGWTAPLSPRTVNELRLGASTAARPRYYVNKGYPTAQSVGIQGTYSADNPLVPPFPKIGFSGTDAFSDLNYSSSSGTAANLASITNNIFSLSDALSTTRGRHQIKTGFEARRTLLNYIFENNGNGTMTFNGSPTAARSAGYSFADFMLGVPSATQLTPLQSKLLLSQPGYAFFAQDDWRATRNLTITMGVREEMFYYPLEQYNRLAMFSPALQGGGMVVACDHGQLPSSRFLPDVVSRLTNAQGVFRFPMACGASLGYDSRRLVHNNPGNWGPRAGIAWDLTGHGKWLVRSGYGTFYSGPSLQQTYALQIGSNPPFASLFNFSQSITNGVPLITLNNPYPTAGASANITPGGIELNYHNPSNQQWNLTIERMLFSNTIVSLGYLGNKGTHLYRTGNLNATQVDPATGAVVQKYQSTFGGAAVNYKTADADSIYNALQAQVRRAFSHGLAFQVNWTWAKGLDDVGTTVNAAVLDTQNLGRDRANSDYVRRHQVNSNFAWEIPVGRGRAFGSGLPGWLNAAAGGWRLSGIWLYSTGRYLTPQYTQSGGLNANNRPDVVYGISPNLPASQRSPQHWFNPAAFAPPPAVDPATGLPRFGNAGRNIVPGPNKTACNASLAKTFPIREKKQVVVRMDVFNVMNHPNWQNPDMNISNVNTVATIADIVGTMRTAQFALEFRF